MRRGLMCIRLGKIDDAERALRVSIMDEFNMTSYQVHSYYPSGIIPWPRE